MSLINNPREIDIIDPTSMTKAEFVSLLEFLYHFDETYTSQLAHTLNDNGWTATLFSTTFGTFKLPTIRARINTTFVYVCGRIDGDGLDVSIIKDEKLAATLDAEAAAAATTTTTSTDTDKWGRPFPKIREPFYTSPYEPYHWYDKYNYWWSPSTADQYIATPQSVIDDLTSEEETEEEETEEVEYAYEVLYNRQVTKEELTTYNFI